MSNTNFLVETMERVGDRKVLWVGTESQWFTWEEFCEIADFEYDSGYGGAEVATDLVVMLEDSWLERSEYDGSEWWEEKKFPLRPLTHAIPHLLASSQKGARGWGDDGLQAINGVKE